MALNLIDAGKAKAGKLWGRLAAEKLDGDEWKRYTWFSHPLTLPHINRNMTGDPQETWIQFLKRRYFSDGPRERGLSLGCGYGFAEREAVELGICREIDAHDLSGDAIEGARKEARRLKLHDKLHYSVSDLDHIELGKERYDLVIAGSILHHLQELEHVLDQVKASLRPDGLLVIVEYIGPNRFQWGEKEEELMNRLLRILPPELRHVHRAKQVKQEIKRPTVAEVIEVDPTEAIRSEEIVALVSERFTIDYRADFGGTLLQFLLHDIVANFSEKNPKDTALINLLVLFEETLIKEGVLSSDFAFFVCRKP